MGILSQVMQEVAPEAAAATPTDESQFARGLRSGLHGAGSQLNTLAGAVAQNYGFTDAAAGRFDAAREGMDAAAAAAPRVSSFRDIGSLRDALDYGAGVLGQSVPSIGASLAAGYLTRGAAMPGVLAGQGAALMPFEMGDVLQRQQEGGQPLDLRSAGATALGSSALQSIVPGLALGKVAGQVGARGMATELLKTPLEGGLTEAAGEAVKQLGSGQGLDAGRLAEAGVGGAVGSAPFGALGAAGAVRGQVGDAAAAVADATRAAGGQVADLAGQARQKTAGALESAPDMPAVVEGLKTRSQEAADAIESLTGRVRDRASGAMERVSQGFPADDIRGLAGKAGDEFNALLQRMDEETIPKVKAWGEQMLGRAGLDEGRRTQLAEAMQDLGSEANRTTVAAMRKGLQATDGAREQAKALFDAAKRWYDTGRTPDDAKKSEDFSGIRKVITDAVAPLLQESNPALFDDPKALQDTADGLRMFIEQVAKREPGQIDSDTVARLIDSFGDRTTDVLNKVYAATRGEDRGSAENFFGALNQIADIQKRDTALNDVLQSNLKQELQNEYTMADVRELSRELKRWVTRTSDGSETARFHDRRVNEMLAQTFDKPDAVLAALQKGVKEEQNVFAKDALETDEEGNPLNPDAVDYTDVLTEGGPQRSLVSKKAVPSPEAHKAEFGNEGQAERLIREATARDGGLSVRWMRAEDFHKEDGSPLPEGAKGMGYVVAERAAGSDKLTPEQAASFKFDTKKGDRRTSKSVVDAGEGVLLDAKKLGRQSSGEELPWNAADDASSMARLQRMFMHNVAAVQETLGRKFKIPDEAVVATRGGQDITFGELRKVKQATELRDGTSPEEGAERAQRLRRELRDLEFGMLDGDRETRQKLRPKWEKLKDQVEQLESADRVRGELEARGISETGVDTNIHHAEALGKVEKIKVGMDGRAIDHTPPLGTVPKGFDPPPGSIMAERQKIKARMKAQHKLDAMHADEDYSSLNTRKQVDEFLAASRGRFKELDAKDDLTADEKKVFGKLYELFGPRSTADLDSFYDGVEGPQSPAAAPDAAAAQAAWVAKAFARDDAKAQINKLTQPQLEALANHLDAAMENGERPPGISALRFKALQQYVSERAYNMEGAPDPKAVAAKKAAFLEKARSGDAALIETLKASNDAKGLQRAAEALKSEPLTDGVRATMNALHERLGELVRNDDAAYGMQLQGKYSLQGTTPGATSTSKLRADTAAYVDSVLDNVLTAFVNIPHAGEFLKGNRRDIIRISVHSLDPLSVAHHEALHAWFKQLSERKLHDVMAPLLKAAESPAVRRQMEQLLANEPAALAQLSDPEERVAYMFQFWSAGTLKVGGDTKTVLGQIADFFRKVLGIWSNDERALHIMEHFEQGVAKGATPSALRRALLEPGTNAALEKAKELTRPLLDLAETVASAGGQRLRDTGVPALRELASLMKATGREEGHDPGFIPAARRERTRIMNAFGAEMQRQSPDAMREAIEALQRGVAPTTLAARIVAATVKKTLADTKAYMEAAGVLVGDLGPDYFPRVWDASYIASHQQDFLQMVEKYARTGQYKGNPRDLMNKLIARDGNEFGTERPAPGMQFLKERLLHFIDHADAAPFMRKDLFETINSYVTQATRRAEWARRFDDDSGKLGDLLDRAEKEGATERDLNAARQFVLGVDGTLGDNINPGLRRLYGNLIVYQNVRLLPLAIFSSVVDPMGVLVRGGTAGDAWQTFARGIKEMRKTFQKSPTFDADTELAETLGVIDDAMLSHTLGELYSQGMVGDTARKINDTFFRYNLMEGFNRSMRVGATRAAIRFIERHADGKASAHSARWVRELNLEPGQIPMQGGTLDLRDERVRVAINMWVDGAVLRPDAADKPIWMNDPHWALVSHLKQFVFAFNETILKRVTHEYNQGNYRPAMALASYVPVMLAADFTKGLLQGGGEQPEWKRNWGPQEYLWSATQRAGLLGVGQFAVDAASDAGQLTGPTIEQLTDGVQAIGGRDQFAPFALKSLPANALYSEAVR
jgi:hypothetical protein